MVNQPPADRKPPLRSAAPPRAGVPPVGAPVSNGMTSPADLTSGPATVEVVAGPEVGRVFTLGLITSIGRSHECSLVLNDGEVSRKHAEIHFENGHYRIVDLGSRNGVRIDDAQVNDAVLRQDQRIKLGQTVLAFREQEAEVPMAARLTLLEKSDLLRGLGPDDRAAVAKELTVQFYPKGSLILAQNDQMKKMWFVHQGRIRVVAINDEGAETLVARLGPGASYGERALVGGGKGGHSLIADSDCYMLELSKERLGSLIKQRPAAGQTLHGMVVDRLRSAQAKATEVAVDAEEREVRSDELEHLVTSTDVEIIGEDGKIRLAKKRLEEWAKEEGALLICGPPGAGKKTFARYYHKVSPRADKPYVELPLADQEPGRITATIFGEEGEGGTPDAQGQAGYLEMIGEGTLTLLHAEILDAHQQMMLVTYLKRGWFQRAFGQERVTSRARIVLVAAGSDVEVLEKLVPELRELLAKRRIVVPPLAARLGDIPLLAEHLLRRASAKIGKRIPGLTREATDRLVSYAWPGNVKELKQVIKRAVIVAPSNAAIPVELIFVVPPEKEMHRVNLLRNDRLRAVLRHPALTTTLSAITTLFVLFVGAITAWGALQPPTHPLQQKALNPGMWLTWHVWFAILPFSAFVLGRAWCGVCPIAFVGDLFGKVARLNLPVPKLFKRLDFWLLLATFLVVDSTEDLLGVADRPIATALFLVLIVGAAVFFTVVFERRTFCRYLCPLSGWLGTYATVSVFEVRGNKKVCQTQCGDHTCYKGSQKAPGCPMFLYPASMTTNAECMLCGNCIKSCENRGVQLNLRPPLQELWQNPAPTVGLAMFALVLAAIMLLHQFVKLPWWKTIETSYQWPPVLTTVGLFGFFLGLTVFGFLAASLMSAVASREKLSQNMARFGLGFVPLALAGHLAFATHKFLTSGILIIGRYFIMLYRSIFQGIPIGSQPVQLPFVIDPAVIGFIKFEILALGILGSLIALIKIARKPQPSEALGRALPHLLLLLLLSGCYLYVFLAT